MRPLIEFPATFAALWSFSGLLQLRCAADLDAPHPPDHMVEHPKKRTRP
jgi:hypothetical protein